VVGSRDLEVDVARRRPLNGRPLLVASAGIAMTIGCRTPEPPMEPPGNLMAPPMVDGELCIDVVPAGAKITVDGVAVTTPCVPEHGYQGQTYAVHAEAPNFLPVDQPVALSPKMTVSITLDPIRAVAPVEPPHGNLIAPPPPHGNLMPPPPHPTPPR
jgi:hypothetical protein